ncbi:hypothetical protein AWB71_05313 [Caballeronia peredens]|nr:hypothetical protein AWB71_05313 [Caballeronia peredens]
MANVVFKELGKLAWKVLRPLIEEAFKDGLAWLFAKIGDIYRKYSKQRADDAQAKANEAAAKADATEDPVEKARQEGREEAYREMAKNYERDMNQLKAELAHLKSQVMQQGVKELAELPNRDIKSLSFDGKAPESDLSTKQ